LLPFARENQVQLPELPPNIERGSRDAKRELTERKNKLEKYLSELLVALANHAPTSLYFFLNVH
jgi:hypothetical protein